MINLLPTDTRQSMLYARRNTALLKWASLLGLTLIGIVIIVGIGMIYLTQTTKSFQKQTENTKVALQSQNIDSTQKQVDEISSNVKLATQVLGREILFSKLLQQLGATLPPESALNQLQIDNLKGGISLTASAKTIESGSQVQVNLADPKNQIFDKADIDSITCEPDDGTKEYPCTVQIRALFKKNNPFLYISGSTKP